MTEGRDDPAVAVRKLIPGVLAGERRAVAGFFNLLEDRRPGPMRAAAEGLDELYRRSAGRGHLLGVTGPPGAGKSSLISRLIRSARADGRSVGVLAVDPSSVVSHGALLGDRIRFEYDTADDGVFVRSMANRGDTGGVSDRAYGGSIALRAAFDLVLIETVGVGQSESEITSLADTTLLVIQPGSGDMLQFIKAGIMEAPDLMVVNKSDHPQARRAWNDLRAATDHTDLTPEEGAGWRVPVLLASARTGEGIGAILESAAAHREHLAARGGLESARVRHAAAWVWRTLLRLYGERGTSGLNGTDEILARLSQDGTPGPFSLLEAICGELDTPAHSKPDRQEGT